MHTMCLSQVNIPLQIQYDGRKTGKGLVVRCHFISGGARNFFMQGYNRGTIISNGARVTVARVVM